MDKEIEVFAKLGKVCFSNPRNLSDKQMAWAIVNSLCKITDAILDFSSTFEAEEMFCIASAISKSTEGHKDKEIVSRFLGKILMLKGILDKEYYPTTELFSVLDNLEHKLMYND